MDAWFDLGLGGDFGGVNKDDALGMIARRASNPQIARGGLSLTQRLSEGNDSDRAMWPPSCSLSFLRS